MENGAAQMEKTQVMPVGVVVERRKVDHAWTDWSWKVIDVVPGPPPVDDWTVLRSGDDWTWFHAATMPIEMHVKEAEAYDFNLKSRKAAVYVVLTDDEDVETDIPLRVHLVTVSPYEAQDYLDSGEDLVEAMEMPDEMIAWVQEFVEKHYVEEPFIKRKRDKHKADEHKFGQEPLAEMRKRQVPLSDNE